MDEDFQKKFRWLVFLLPGAVSLGILEFVANVEIGSDFEKVMWALAFTLVNFTIAWVLYRLVRRGGILFKVVDPEKQEPPLSALLVSFLLVVSIITGILTGAVTSEDWFLKAIRDTRIGDSITKRSYQRPLTFLLARNSLNEIEDGRPFDIRREKGE